MVRYSMELFIFQTLQIDSSFSMKEENAREFLVGSLYKIVSFWLIYFLRALV